MHALEVAVLAVLRGQDCFFSSYFLYFLPLPEQRRTPTQCTQGPPLTLVLAQGPPLILVLALCAGAVFPGEVA